MSEDKTVTEILRGQFPAEHVGKLPRVTCPNCSKGNCGEHKREKCAVCDSYVSTRHIHLDYVGHADVTSRLLDADPEWGWQPKATDPDPELLKAAVASGNPEIVKAVIENAPPKFETDRSGNPVGLWIKLTVGGVTRLGVGSCPGGQNDAEKVLIGDALRNAAMRFGVAVDLWAKGDRADPTAENATASSGQVARGGRQSAADAFEKAAPAQAAGNGRVSRPAPQSRENHPPTADLGDWGIRIDGLTSEEDAERADAELREMFRQKQIDATRANQIRSAIKMKAAQLAQPAEAAA